MTEKPDTDPLADTQDSGGSSTSTSTSTSPKRVVHAGDVLGRYELVEEVGEGGMATVYRAKDRELRRDVAVKVLFPHLAKRPEVVRRFQREARAAAALDHANILRVYDVGGGEAPEVERGGPAPPREVDPPYIVMELVRGRSLLAEIEQRGPLLAELAACVGALLADALAAAHAAGVIHRDVKPANVMIASGGRVLLADFGVARLETEDSLVTKTGALLGTPAYMSPEQATGDTATAKSDLYSLGATLYQLATGALPYSGSPAKVLASIAQGALVPPVKRKANVGPDLSRAITDMMQSDAGARPASAISVGKQLRAIASGGGLGDPAKELAEYFADPDAYLKARTPGIVKTIVGEAKHALDDARLPRALALADRATALAPEDPEVTQLVRTVTEGGRAARRRRALAIAAAAPRPRCGSSPAGGRSSRRRAM
ncbi:MAG: serine/threonine-protein kinase, partial [Acidobacteriota bacterium]